MLPKVSTVTIQQCPCPVNHYLTANGTLVSLAHTFTSKDLYMKFLMTCTVLIYSSIAGLSYIMCIQAINTTFSLDCDNYNYTDLERPLDSLWGVVLCRL